MWRGFKISIFLLFFFLFYSGCVSSAPINRTSLPPTAFKKINIFVLKDGYLQITFKTSGWFRYKTFILLPAKGLRKNPCIVIDFWPVYLPKGMKKSFISPDSNIKKIHIAQYNKRTVRAVIHLKNKLPYIVKKEGNSLIVKLKLPPQQKKICIKDVKISYSFDNSVCIKIKTTARPYYKDFILPPLKSKRLPARLVIDMWPAYIPKGVKGKKIITHPLISALRIAQFNKERVRIVLSLKKEKIPYKISYQKDTILLTAFASGFKKSLSLPQALGLKIKKVVIDPGHGGKDPGAIGYHGLKEKDVTLKLAKLLKQKLETKLGCQVLLTRYSDKFIPLEERTALANRVKADLFISIHCNACPTHRLHGVETYFLGFTEDKQALMVASRENASVTRRLGELDKILQDLLINAKIKESAYLAAEIQEHIIKTLTIKRYNPVTDLGVKQAPFYVLIGTKMPAVLVEASFIDHPKEGKRLRDYKYLNILAEGILKGIHSYIHTIEEAYKYTPIEAGKGG